MRRRLFTLAAGVSVAAFVGVCVLWARGYAVGDRVSYATGFDSHDHIEAVVVASGGGRFAAGRSAVRMSVPVIDPARARAVRFTRPDAVTWGRRDRPDGPASPPDPAWGGSRQAMGFARWWSNAPAAGGVVTVEDRFVEVPYAAAALLFAALPAWWFWTAHWGPLRRTRAGLCPACRYDLRGNVSGVCPECGTRVAW